MIKLKDALITDGLPEIISSKTWAKALAYATNKQIRNILEKAKITRLYASIDLMPEEVLDLMAFDLQVQSYKERYDIEVKRSLIKTALNRRSKAGTKSVVEELCTKIFGDASILEWYEYEGRPHYFKVTCNSAKITEEDIEDFKEAVESIKRLSSWLDGIELLLTLPAKSSILGFSIYKVDEEQFKLLYDVKIKINNNHTIEGSSIFDYSHYYFKMKEI